MRERIIKKRHTPGIFKKAVSFLLIVAMIICCVPMGTLDIRNNVSVVEAAGNYSVDAAISYAEAHWNDNQGLCAEFVARCVQAGGIGIPTYTLTNQVYDAIINQTGIQGQWLNLTSSGYALYSRNCNILSRGDVVISWCEGYGHLYRPHIMICGGYDSAGYATFYAHNNARHNERVPASAGRCGVCGRSNGQLRAKVLHISQLSGPVGEMVTPTISTNRSCYGIGETANISWSKTGGGTDFYCYWLVITNTDTGTQCVGGATGAEGNVDANSYNFTIPDSGHYRIDVYAVPRYNKESRQKKASKTVWTYDKDSQNVNLGNDFWAYIINTGNKKCLTVESNDNVTIRTASQADSQKWHFIRQSNGSYEIVSKSTGKALDDYNWGQANGTNVGVFTRNNSTAQKWFVRGTSGAYFFNTICGSAVIDVTGNASADGTNVEMYEKNDTGAQKFTIQKIVSLGKCNMTGLKKGPYGYDLSWDPVSGAAKYYIYRKKMTDSSYSRIAVVNGSDKSSYTDKTCSSGTVYEYKVVAADNNNNSGSAGKGYHGMYILFTSLYSKGESTDSVSLIWNRILCAEGYYLYCYNESSGEYEKIYDAKGGNTTEYTLTGLKPDTEYKLYIKVYATYTYNNSQITGTSYRSNILNIRTAPEPVRDGMVEEGGMYYYYKDGQMQNDYTGLVKCTDGSWWYVECGEWQEAYTGLIRHTSGSWYYVVDGRMQSNYTGLVKHTTGSWYYVKNGRIQNNYTGLVKHTTGTWYYVKNGRMQSNYTGLVKHTAGSWYYVKNGKMQNNYSGWIEYANGTWYYVKNGKVQYN